VVKAARGVDRRLYAFLRRISWVRAASSGLPGAG
jgi:hypothetical protein